MADDDLSERTRWPDFFRKNLSDTVPDLTDQNSMIGVRKAIDEQYPVRIAVRRCFASAERTGRDDGYIGISEVANGRGELGDQIVGRGPCVGDRLPSLSQPLLQNLNRRWHSGSVSDPSTIRNFYPVKSTGSRHVRRLLVPFQ